MTSFPAALRAWVEQLPKVNGDNGRSMHEYVDADLLLARLDVFAKGWEDRKGGRCINCEGAIAWHQDRRWNADGNVGPFCARCYELDTAAITAERDALKVELQNRDQQQPQDDSEDEITRLKKQLAAGDAARAALRDALEAFLNAANEYYLDSELTDSAPIQVVQRFLETRIVIQKLLAAERTTS